MDAISEARLQEICPALADDVRKLASALAFPVRVVQGLRSWNDQAKLYAQGRDENGTAVDASKIVTKAPPGYTWHNFGLAVDLVPFDSEGQPDWNASHPNWKEMERVGESLGLVAGAEWRTFPDNPHFQLTGRFPVTPTDEVRQIFADAGMAAVWDAALAPEST